jgi:cellulose biosynthesis protein BcsQ
MKCLVVANTAGGVGKSTTAHALAVAAVEYGKKTLLIDADPAATLTFYCGIENPRITTGEFLTDAYSLDATINKTSERFNFLPSSTRLSGVDIDQSLTIEKLRAAVDGYDLVIIDTATGPNRLMTYFLSFADLIVTTTTSEIAALRGALHIKNFAHAAGYSKEVDLLFVRASKDVPVEIKEQVKSDFRILDPAIREDELVPQSQTSGKSVLTTNKDSEVSADYREICYSILEELELI